MLLGGLFSTLTPNGAVTATPRNGFARLLNDLATQSLTASNATTVNWTRGGSSPEVSQVTFELSTDGGTNWTPLGNGVRVSTTADWQLSGLALPASGQLRARGRTTAGLFNGSSGLIESLAGFGVGGVLPPVIDVQSLTRLGNGSFQFTFTDRNNIGFSVVAATNVSLAVSNWTVLGAATNLGNGLYQFTDLAATNFRSRYYRLRFP